LIGKHSPALVGAERRAKQGRSLKLLSALTNPWILEIISVLIFDDLNQRLRSLPASGPFLVQRSAVFIPPVESSGLRADLPGKSNGCT
jgi:hypothetical protein